MSGEWEYVDLRIFSMGGFTELQGGENKEPPGSELPKGS